MSDMSGDFKVGYAKPPVEHRFQKGQSGNTKGRPKGARAKPKTVNTDFGMQGAEEYLRLEAYRPVRIREGEEVIELPAIQAVFRAMGVSALKGNRFVQKTLAELVAKMERDRHRLRMDAFGTAVEYKHKWDQEIERCRKAGLAGPTPLPHPDDIILDVNTGGVNFQGPQTKEQKARFDEAIERRAQAREDVSYFAQKHRRSRSRSPARTIIQPTAKFAFRPTQTLALRLLCAQVSPCRRLLGGAEADVRNHGDDTQA